MNAVDQVSSPSRSLLVKKSITVAANPEKAFRVFAEEIHTWWPLASHHIGKSDPETVTIEPFVGGRCFERGVDGSECTWGHVRAWEPGRRLMFTWEIGSDWQADPTLITEIEVLFTPDGTRTRVDLEHRLLERYGDKADDMQKAFDSPDGWTSLLQTFSAKVSES